MNLPHACPRCNTRWGGYKTMHCTSCHQTFTSLGAFDKHRDGSHTTDTRHCVDPTKVGLMDAERGYPCWGWPASDTRWRENREEVDAA